MDTKKESRGWIYVLAGLGALLLLQMYLGGRPHELEGQPAPTFEARTLDGQTMALADHLGEEVVLLDFWATWCPPCRDSMPVVEAIAEDYEDAGVAVYAVNQGDAPEHIQGFLEDMGIDPPVLLDPASAIAEKYGVSGIPQLVIIGKEGNVDSVIVGAGPGLDKTLRTRLDALLEGGAAVAAN